MLPLDDPRWSSLSHAYGAASDTPILLRQLAQSPGPSAGADAEPWFSLWSGLCHQGDVFSASYAALPHIVDIGLRASGQIDFSFFQLPAAIEVARVNCRGPPVPPDLLDDYQKALAALIDIAMAHRNDPWDQAMILSVAAALSVAKGDARTAEALANLDDDWIEKLIDPGSVELDQPRIRMAGFHPKEPLVTGRPPVTGSKSWWAIARANMTSPHAAGIQSPTMCGAIAPMYEMAAVAATWSNHAGTVNGQQELPHHIGRRIRNASGAATMSMLMRSRPSDTGRISACMDCDGRI